MGDHGMPYHLEKGPYWSVAEAVMNASKEDRYKILEAHRQGLPLNDPSGSGWALTSTTLNDPTHAPTTAARAKHANDFMGGTYNSKKKWVRNAGPGTNTVGFRNYEGNVEEILRITFTRAIEVSLGLQRGETLDKQPPSRARFWPIEYVWKCPTAWVEGWVTWQRAPDGSGHVTVHLLTPPHGNQPVLTRIEGGRNAAKEPKECDVANGMWVISHRYNNPTYKMRIEYSEFGVWFLPTFGPVYSGDGPIVTVAPSEADGGVAPWGREYGAPGRLANRVAKKATKKKATKKKKLPPGIAKQARKKVGPRHA
jgi:hypothetical protein